MKLIKHRIVRDNNRGYEAQKWRLWFPFWVQINKNTHSTIERAEAYIKGQGVVVKYVDF